MCCTLSPVAHCQDGDGEEGDGEQRPRHRSSGASHSAAVKLGLFNASLKAAQRVSAVVNDGQIALVRNVFGKFSDLAAAAGMKHSQNLAVFAGQDGDLEAFDFASDFHSTAARQRNVCIYSRMKAQEEAIQRIIGGARPTRHCIVSLEFGTNF